jgi:DNA N-6-adenine-methyltransferase (Dam)
MTLGSHQQCVGKSQDHITPKWMLDRPGSFDLDPAAAEPRPWDCAKLSWTSGSLERVWPKHLLIFLNQPFLRYVVGAWVRKAAEHNNRVVLLHARCEAEWFEPVWECASGILFLADRIHFHKPDGTRQPANSGAPAVLVAFGAEALARLRRCGIAGVLVTEWEIRPGTPARECSRRPQPTNSSFRPLGPDLQKSGGELPIAKVASP